MKKIKLTVTQFRSVMNAVRDVVKKDDKLSALRFACGKVESNRLTVDAVNGYSLSRVELELENESDEAFRFYFIPFQIPKDLERVEIERLGIMSCITLYCEGSTQTIHFNQDDEGFIDADKLFPETDQDLSIVFNTELLIRALKAYTSTRYPSVRLDFVRKGGGIDNARAVTLSNACEDGENVRSIVLPIRQRR